MNERGKELPVVMLEFWQSDTTRENDYKEYIQNGTNIIDLGELGPIGRRGWYIPYFMAEMGDFVKSYHYYQNSKLIPFINCVPQVLSLNTKIIQNLKLNLNVTPLNVSEDDSEKCIISNLEEAERTKTPLVAYFWEPHRVFSRQRPPQNVRLPFKGGYYPPVRPTKLQSQAVNNLSPNVQLFLKHFLVRNEDQIQILGDVYYEKMSIDDAAKKWLRNPNNSDLIKSWFEYPPDPMYQNVVMYVGVSFLAVVVGILFGLVVIVLSMVGYFLRRQFLIKEENKRAPKQPPICIVFTHIHNAPLLWTLGLDVMKKVMNIHNRVVRENIKKYKGYEVKTHLDCFMIAFQCPFDAVACCMAIQKELLSCEWTTDMMAFPDMQEVVWNEQVIYKGPRVRMGVHFGYDIEAQYDSRTKRFDYFGTTVNKASRIEKVSSGGRVYISAETFHSIQNMTFHEFKPAIAGRPSLNNFESSVIMNFKQSILKGEVTFKNVGERELKGLEGKHTIYWVKDMTQLRYAYIEQFEMSPRPPSLMGRIIPVAVIDSSDRDKYELYEAITQGLSDPSQMKEDELSVLLQRIILFPNELERNRWITAPNTALLRFVTNFMLNYNLRLKREPPSTPKTPKRLFEIFNINH
ncbi:hypothetical protein FDP41_009781 [Naegleria fowleri]|uniref:Guanylate cyclase domain-containing protein n=1 Tax=Naegleria fowleri TaxID=5763 RepID=A0A6A5BDA0_NAEFO|nr:uncharacterized protein FDP41_009781 [Naegleria fowleri]KAF0972085.1 hypothetical protein FDP41_009781 [Naegleria fowleri]